MLHTPLAHAFDFRNGAMRITAGAYSPAVGKRAGSDSLDVEWPTPVLLSRELPRLVTFFEF